MGLVCRVRNTLLHILIIFLSIIFTPFCLLSPLFFLPLVLWRGLVGHFGRLLDPKKLELMSARNSVVAIDDLHSRPEQSIVVSIGMSGPIPFDRFLQEIEPCIIGEDALYPEFQKLYESWAGYLFWKMEENFDLTTHIHKYRRGSDAEESDPIGVTYDELKLFCLDLVRKPFVEGKSPWEILLVNNFVHGECSNFSVIIIRVHHGLCDGFSILQFFTGLIHQWENTKDKLPSAVWAKGAIRPTFVDYALMTLLTPYNLLKQVIYNYDSNPFRVSRGKLKKRLLTAQIKISIDQVKQIKRDWSVTFSTIVFAAIVGGFRNYMLAHKLRPIPQSFHVGVPFPWPHRKGSGLQNNMCVCILEFPVGVKTLEGRVEACERNWVQVKRSTVPLMNWTLMPLMGLLPSLPVKLFLRNNVTTMVLSNFPGPQERLHIENISTEDVEFVTGLWRGNCGIGIGLISCNGILKINVGLDEALVSSQDQVDQIAQFIQNEFDILKTHINPLTTGGPTINISAV